MKDKANFLFLKQEDAIKAGVLDMKLCLADVEECLKLLSAGQIENPSKTIMKHYKEDGSYQFMLNSMPVYIGGENETVGIKWAGESPLNGKTHAHPMGIDVMIVNDCDTILPVAIMDATLITAMRTSACTTTAIKYLAADNAKTVAIIGAGVIGRTMLMALRDVERDFGQIRLADLDKARAQALADDFKNELDVVVAESTEAACRGADIVVTCTTAKSQVVENEWLDACTLRCQCGGNEYPAATILEADQLVVDNWVQLSHATTSYFSELVAEGKLKREEALELPDVVAGKHGTVRKSDSQKLMYMSMGLACLDLKMADRVYRTAKAQGLGVELNLWDEPIWV